MLSEVTAGRLADRTVVFTTYRPRPSGITMVLASPRIPPFVASVFSHFPLVTYPAPPLPSPAPTSPTLWLLGPPFPLLPSNESLDPVCRFVQTYARFRTVGVEVQWRSSVAGAPGETLPALHLPSGELLSTEEVLGWLTTPTSALSPPSPPSEKKPSDPTQDAFTALLRTTLLPAVLAALYLSPHPPVRSPVPSPTNQPLLSAWVASFFAASQRRARVAELITLRGRKVGSRAMLDLEEVERDGVETLAALEDKFRKDGLGSNSWFGNADAPSELDAWIYALLSLVLLTPPSPLRDQLDRSPRLLAWVKQHQVLK